MVMVAVNADRVSLLYEAFQPRDPGIEEHDVPPGTVCAIGGHPIRRGCRIADVVTDTTARPHEIFRCGGEYVSVEAAWLYKAAARTGGGIAGNMLAIEGQPGERPMLSRDSADKQGRRAWPDVLMDLAPGLATVAIITTESKRRLWLDARVSITGDAWQPYLCWGTTDRTLTVSLSTVQALLPLAEQAYGLGWSKQDILDGLLHAGRAKLVQKVGLSRALELDRAFAAWRGSDELLLTAAVVQKPRTPITLTEETSCPPPKTPSRPPSSPTPTSSEPSGQLALFG
ncbi:MAG TPA: hypothetical protein VF158_14890 [Longimicrobiales bacterium]